MTKQTSFKKMNLLLFSLFISCIFLFNNNVLEVKADTTVHSNEAQEAILLEAFNHLGKPYEVGGKGPNKFDCSGFTKYVYETVTGKNIGDTTYSQINSGIEVSYSELQPGDLVFLDAGHVGIYIGNGKIIHAPKSNDVVRILNINSSYVWRARRIIIGNTTIRDEAALQSFAFDYNFYANKYSDLRNVYGYDKVGLYSHWKKYGIKEGRCASPVIDLKYYINNNNDIKSAFGTNYSKAYNHYIAFGAKEKREFSPVYFGRTYASNYSDLKNLSGVHLIQHFTANGMKEGRVASNNFNVNNYKARYSDLRQAFGNNNKAYFEHYMIYGIVEGRNGK